MTEEETTNVEAVLEHICDEFESHPDVQELTKQVLAHVCTISQKMDLRGL